MTVDILAEILTERERQIQKGFTADHDDQHFDGSLVLCARAILGHMPLYDQQEWTAGRVRHVIEKHDMRTQLVIAAALIVAEIGRLDRVNG